MKITVKCDTCEKADQAVEIERQRIASAIVVGNILSVYDDDGQHRVVVELSRVMQIVGAK